MNKVQGKALAERKTAEMKGILHGHEKDFIPPADCAGTLTLRIASCTIN